MGYREEEIITLIKESLSYKDEQMPVYRLPCLNYRGNAVGSSPKKKYTEIIAMYLCENKSALDDSIRLHKPKPRVCYNVGHDGIYNGKNKKRSEKIIAYDLFNRSQKDCHIFAHIGKIIDYETPVSSAEDDNSGEIDLLSWDEHSGEMLILELKRPDTPESLLRCILEAYTYRKSVCCDTLAKSFGHEGAGEHVQAATLVFKDSRPHIDWKNESNQPFVRELMTKLGVGLFILDNDPSLNVIEAHRCWSSSHHNRGLGSL
jgi:hypothetical protein